MFLCYLAGMALIYWGLRILGKSIFPPVGGTPPTNGGTAPSQQPRNGSGGTPPRTVPPPRPQNNGAARKQPPPMPPRHVMPNNFRGPRGVRPEQFPCCPLDKQRNLPGEPQRIFWDSRQGCYYCARGHRFQSNGRIQ